MNDTRNGSAPDNPMGTDGFEFVEYDDVRYVVQNPLVRQGLTASGLRAAFSASVRMGAGILGRSPDFRTSSHVSAASCLLQNHIFPLDIVECTDSGKIVFID